MRAYEAYYENGQIIPIGNPVIPEGSRVILTVLDNAATENPILKQREAIDKFIEQMRTCDETLSSAFDAIISQRANLSRETDI